MKYYINSDRKYDPNFGPEFRLIFSNTPKGRVGGIHTAPTTSTPKDYTNALYKVPKNNLINPNTLFVFKTATLFMVTSTEYIYAVTVQIPKELVIYKGANDIIPGIAQGGLFASSAYLERTDNSSDWMSEVSGSSFGWIDIQTGLRYTDDKRNFRAPTAQEYIDLFI